jgi:hypothetical protein
MTSASRMHGPLLPRPWNVSRHCTLWKATSAACLPTCDGRPASNAAYFVGIAACLAGENVVFFVAEIRYRNRHPLWTLALEHAAALLR